MVKYRIFFPSLHFALTEMQIRIIKGNQATMYAVSPYSETVDIDNMVSICVIWEC